VLFIIYVNLLIYLCVLANAAGDDILPYFPQILEALKQFLVQTVTEDQLKVQIDAIGLYQSFVN